MKDTEKDLLVKISLFKSFSEDELATISTFMDLIEVEKNKTVFEEGEPGDYVCFVLDGRLDVYKKTWKGEGFIINTLSRGQSFGEISIIENIARSATLKASEKTTYVTLKRNDFDSILEEHPKIGCKILKGLCGSLIKKLRTTSSRLIDYMSTHP